MSRLRARRNLACLQVDTFAERLTEEGRVATARTPVNKLTAVERDTEREFHMLDDLVAEQMQGKQQRLPRFNPSKDVCAKVLPYIEHRAQTLEGGYVNASLMSGTAIPGFIAAQGPLSGTITDFWSMVANHRATQIVALCADDECANYMPTVSEPLSLLNGALTVQLISTEILTTAEGLCRSQLEVCSGGETWEVSRIHCSLWRDEQTPPLTPLLRLAELVNTNAGAGTDAGAAVVHCRAGVGRTGCFIALCSLMADVENQLRKVPDCVPCASVARTVIDVRMRRPHMVQTQQQYELLHSALQKWYQTRCGTTYETASSDEEVTPALVVSVASAVN